MRRWNSPLTVFSQCRCENLFYFVRGCFFSLYDFFGCSVLVVLSFLDHKIARELTTTIQASHETEKKNSNNN
jgi:hypothetical protein